MKRLASLCGTALVAAAAWAPMPSQAAIEVLNEGFNNVNSLPGWSQLNLSTPPGNAWFQGNAGVFGARSGPGNSYAAVNFLSARDGIGAVDNWLITPTLSLGGLTTLSFYVNSAGSAGFSHLLEVRFASGSTGTGLDAFDTLLLTIGSEGNFPTDWSRWTTSFNAAGDGRFAFRYLGDASTLEFIGLDSVRVVTAVPEPSTYLMLLAGLGAVAASARRLRK
jgi:hypothetical protein